jgi:hypothetical protein
MRQLTFVEPGRFEWRDVDAPREAIGPSGSMLL